MVQLAKEDPRVFCTLLGRLLPIESKSEISYETSLKAMTDQELDEQFDFLMLELGYTKVKNGWTKVAEFPLNGSSVCFALGPISKCSDPNTELLSVPFRLPQPYGR